MSIYLIQDKNIGFVQYVAEGVESPMAALQEFDEVIGVDPNEEGLNLDDWHITEVTAEQAKEALDWAEKGHPSDEAPDWVK